MARRRSRGSGSTYYHKSKKRWTAEITVGYDLDGKRIKRTSSYFNTQREADAWRRQAALNRDRGIVLAQRGTVGELLRDWLEHGEHTKGWSPSHVRRSAQIVRYDLANLARLRATDLTVEHVETVLNAKRAAGASPNTIRLVRAALSAALNLGVRRGIDLRLSSVFGASAW